MALENNRRQQTQQSMGLTTTREQQEISRAVAKEQKRQRSKQQRRQRLEKSWSYQAVKGIQRTMDGFFLDPILGFVLPGVGDVLTSTLTLPFIYVALVKIRSIPLTLAVIFNAMMDCLVGTIPVVGNFADIFYRSFKKSYRLIVGYVEDDKEIIEEVEEKAVVMGVLIAIVGVLLYFAVHYVVKLVDYIIGWF